MKRNAYDFLDKLILCLLSLSIVLFIFLPFCAVFKESFFLGGSLSFSYFGKIFKASLGLLKNSIRLGVLTTFFSVFFSIILAIYTYLATEGRKKAIIFILLLTLISPPFVTSLSFISLFGRRGLISYHLLGIRHNPYGLNGIVFMQTMGDLSLNSLLLFSYLVNVDQSLVESARSFGARTNDIIRDILLPALKSGLKAVIVLTFFRSISDFGTPSIIGGNYNVLASESYFAVIAQGNLTKASILNLLMLIPSILVYFFYSRDKRSTSLAAFSGKSELVLERRGRIYRTFKIFSLIFLAILSLLYFAIILSAFTKMKLGKLVFTFDNFRKTRGFIKGIYLRSVAYSLISAFFGSLLGLIIGYYSVIRKIKGIKFIDFFANLPYIIPGTFFGLGYLLFFKKPPLVLTGTALIVILNVTFKQLPFSSRIGSAAMEEINPEILEAVRDLGGSSIYELKDIIIPLSKNSLALSFVNAFRATMTTIGSIIFLVYPQRKVLTLVMYDAIAAGKYDVGAVIALIIILTCLLVYLIYFILMGGKKNHVFGS